MYLSASIPLTIHLFTHLYIHPSPIYPSIYPSIYQSIHLSLQHPSIRLPFIYPSTHLYPIHLSINSINQIVRIIIARRVYCNKALYNYSITIKTNIYIFHPSYLHSVSLYGRDWKPVNSLRGIQRECHEISDLLDVKAVTGADATKQRAMTEIRTATVLHIGEC